MACKHVQKEHTAPGTATHAIGSNANDSWAAMQGTLLLQGDLDCTAKVHFPGQAGLQAAAVAAAVKGTPPGYGRLLAVCERLAEVAEANDRQRSTQRQRNATSGACTAEAADETAPLNVFSNPLYTYATPKNIRKSEIDPRPQKSEIQSQARVWPAALIRRKEGVSVYLSQALPRSDLLSAMQDPQGQ